MLVTSLCTEITVLYVHACNEKMIFKCLLSTNLLVCTNLCCVHCCVQVSPQ